MKREVHLLKVLFIRMGVKHQYKYIQPQSPIHVFFDQEGVREEGFAMFFFGGGTCMNHDMRCLR